MGDDFVVNQTGNDLILTSYLDDLIITSNIDMMSVQQEDFSVTITADSSVSYVGNQFAPSWVTQVNAINTDILVSTTRTASIVPLDVSTAPYGVIVSRAPIVFAHAMIITQMMQVMAPPPAVSHAIEIAQMQATILQPRHIFGKILSAIQSQNIQLKHIFGRGISSIQSRSVHLQRVIGTELNAMQSQNAQPLRIFGKALSAIQSQNTQLQRVIGTALNAMQSQLVQLTPIQGSAPTTLNPADLEAHGTLSNGNLTYTDTQNGGNCIRSIKNHSTGKYYCSMHVDTFVTEITFGITGASFSNVAEGSLTNDGYGYVSDGRSLHSNVGMGLNNPGYGTSDTVDLAVDMDNHKIWWRTNNGNWNGNVGDDPATNTGGATIGSSITYSAGVTVWANSFVTMNFGGSAYTNAAPSGFGNW